MSDTKPRQSGPKPQRAKLIPSVIPAESPVRLEPIGGGAAVQLRTAVSVIAATPKAQGNGKNVQLHLLLVQDGEVIYVRDLSGQVELQVNERPTDAAELRHGDKVRLGLQDYLVHNQIKSRGKASDFPIGKIDVGGSAALMELTGRATVLGSGERADVRVTGRGVEPQHAVIVRLRGGLCVWPLGGAKTLVNGAPARATMLGARAVILLGERALTFVADAPLAGHPGASTREARVPKPQAAESQRGVEGSGGKRIGGEGMSVVSGGQGAAKAGSTPGAIQQKSPPHSLRGSMSLDQKPQVSKSQAQPDESHAGAEPPDEGSGVAAVVMEPGRLDAADGLAGGGEAITGEAQVSPMAPVSPPREVGEGQGPDVPQHAGVQMGVQSSEPALVEALPVPQTRDMPTEGFKQWGPLAFAMVSSREAGAGSRRSAPEDLSTNESGGKWWWVVGLLLMVMLAGGAAVYWWKFRGA